MPVIPRRGIAVMVCGLGVLLVGCTTPPSVSPTAPPTRAAAPLAAATPPSPASPVAKPSSVASPSTTTSTGAAATTPIASEQPIAAETNPAGDIPDNQVFVAFASSSGGYQLQVPEGWGRTDNNTDVRFVSKLDGVQVAVTNASAPPTAASAQSTQVADLQRSGRAVQVNSVNDVQLPAGPAVLVDYSSNSDPDPVTGKQVRLDDNAYLFFHNGKLATLTLWAPLGADNVDQWQQMAQSFRWQ